MITFKRLEAADIECRVAQVTKDGDLMLLLYKNARVDQRYLDDAFGIFGWQRHHEIIGGNLYCTVSVKNPDTGEWISKQDVGVESNTEKEKGQASDSFKRACFNLGIGRELYTAPQIWVRRGDYTVNSKGGTYDRFTVKDIAYDANGNIGRLIIFNNKTNKIVFTYGDGIASQKIGQAKINSIVKKCEDSGINPAIVCDKMQVADLSDLTEKQYKWIAANWTKEIVNGMQGGN